MAKVPKLGMSVVYVLLVFLLQRCRTLAVRQNAGCGFHIQTNGSDSFPVGQLASGQARAGRDMKPSLFTWFGDAFIDQQGRGCWWTRICLREADYELGNFSAPTFILQCDPGQMPDHGHEVNCDGQLAFRGQTTFYQCETGDGDQVNIYTVPSGVRCNYITLFADGCHPDCGQGDQASAPLPTYQPSSSVLSSMARSSVSPPSATGNLPSSSKSASPDNASSLSSQTTTTSDSGFTPPSSASVISETDSSTSDQPSTSTAECTPNLEGQSESPHLMVSVDRAHPDQAYGPSFYGQISPNASTFYNFDIPASDAGKTCTLFFDFPRADLTSTGYMWSGTGKLTFEEMRGSVISNTTFNSRPDVIMELASLDMEPGNRYVINTFQCPAGDRVTFHLREDHVTSDTSSGVPQDHPGTCLYYLQEHKPVPMGLFMSKC